MPATDDHASPEPAAMTTTTTDPPAVDLSAIVLTSGGHDPGDGFCAMELVAHLAGEPWSTSPQCTDNVLSRFAVRLNDAAWPTDADRTEAFRALSVGYPATADAPARPALLLNTRSTPAVSRARRAYLADCALRWYAPLALMGAVVACEPRGIDCAALRAAALRLCEEPTADNAILTRDAARVVRRAAYAAAYAADAAAYAYAAAYAADAADAAAYAYAADAAAYAYAAAAAADADARLVVLRLAAEHLEQACAITEAMLTGAPHA